MNCVVGQNVPRAPHSDQCLVHIAPQRNPTSPSIPKLRSVESEKEALARWEGSKVNELSRY